MIRSIPYEDDTRCDECGRVGAYDFMGDILCEHCFAQEEAEYWADMHEYLDGDQDE